MPFGPPPRIHLPARKNRVPRVVTLLLGPIAVGLPMFACNALTGAGDFTLCDDTNEACGSSSGLGPDAARDGNTFSPFDAQVREGGGFPRDGSVNDSSFPMFDSGEAPKDAAVPCSTCDSGTCQSTGGGCQTDEPCCAGLKCSAQGKCVSSCVGGAAGGNDFCFGAPCCVGYKCSIALSCEPCALGGDNCQNNQGCCSNSCVSNQCVGNVPAPKGN